MSSWLSGCVTLGRAPSSSVPPCPHCDMESTVICCCSLRLRIRGGRTPVRGSAQGLAHSRCLRIAVARRNEWRVLPAQSRNSEPQSLPTRNADTVTPFSEASPSAQCPVYSGCQINVAVIMVVAKLIIGLNISEAFLEYPPFILWLSAQQEPGPGLGGRSSRDP